MSESSVDTSRGIAELRAAMNALQTSLENLDAELYPRLSAWSPQARAARDAAIAEWVETARHMQALLNSLEANEPLGAEFASLLQQPRQTPVC